MAEAGEGPPLLMLHGWPQHWGMWRHQIPELSKKYRLICPDLRGFGWSEAPPSGYEKEELADDIVSLLDKLAIDQTRLMGHDWGGWVGFLLSLREPKRFFRFLALNIPHPFQKIDSRLLVLWRFWYQWVIASPFLGKWMLKDRRRFVRFLLKKGMYRQEWTEQELALYSAQFDEADRARASVALYRSFLLQEFLPTVRGKYAGKRLKVPTLLLFGENDFAVSKRLLRGHEAHADDLRIELVRSCGHFIAEEQPKHVTRKALEFFAD